MTYVNHRDTESTENAQSSIRGVPRDFCVASGFSVSLWLTYVIKPQA
jgi:hypothetical protein